MNATAVDGIIAATKNPTQLGGGIRDMKTVAGWLEKGVTRVIIGTAAVRDPDFVREAARAFPGRIAVGIDARDGLVAVDGWARLSNLTAGGLHLITHFGCRLSYDSRIPGFGDPSITQV